MLTQMNLIKMIYRHCTNCRKVWLTVVSLAMVMLGHAQCPPHENNDATVGTRDIQYPSGTICDVNWGWDPWGCAKSDPVDPMFTDNGGIYPNNDGRIIAGYDFLADCATNCPLYNDKLFFYDPKRNGGFTRSFKFPAYPVTKIRQITPIDQRYSLLGIIYARTTQYNEPKCPEEMVITPRATDNSNPVKIYMVLYGFESQRETQGNHYNTYSSFTYTIEQPQWKPEANIFLNICQENRTYNLADFFSVPGARFNIDHAHRDTIWRYPNFPCSFIRCYSKDYQRARGWYTLDYIYTNQINTQDLSPGVHTLYATKTYDNGADDATFGSHRGEVEFPFTITVLPAAPVIGNLSITPSCFGSPSGRIDISGVTGGDGKYKYILRYGDRTTGCIPPACFDDIAAWDDFSGGNVSITGVAGGHYTLWIANNGSNTGACFRTQPVDIPQLSKMDTLPIAIQHISCPNGNNGFIHVTDTGGRAPYTYTLNSGSNTWNNDNGAFNSLTAGTYVMNTQDGCGRQVQRTIELKAPAPVNITATASPTDCNLPANGAIEVNATGGSGTFDYYLYDNNGNTVTQQLGSKLTNWQIAAVGAGKYTVSVENTLAPGCTPTTKLVEVFGPQALYINYLSQTDNTCSYDAMGTLALSGGGGQENGYIFFLQNTATGDLFQSTTGNFCNLPAAAYKAWIRNKDLTCLDSTIYASPISILSPPALTADASATDITCNGKGNGTLQTVINGGTPGYNLQWQQWESQAANWLPVSGRTGTTENNLEQGRYRLLVTDQHNCYTYSDTVDIAEPNTLTIKAVNRTDIVCYGETGSIQMTVSGGNTSYAYAYSIDNGQNWNAFTAATPLPAASYQVKVSDNKGCETIYNQPVEITTPASKLAMNYALTDYNGFNVPCYGSTNGEVLLTATGGNGSNYSGYTYSVDNGPYGVSNKVTTNAGNHTFYVKDARGCIVTATASLTEPAAEIKSTVAITDNDCAGGQAGIVTVSTTGGTPQYTYSINGTTFQSSNVFTGLAARNYQVTARDVNGCLSKAAASIVDLNPPITDRAVINDVLCYNGSDGKITLSPSGGVPTYNYTWKGSAVSGNVLSGLPTGSYAVVITDSKGCTLSETFAVGQPAQPLSATTYARPVCINNPNGYILFNALGGTPPYQYSINSGSNFSNNAQFNNLAAGTYPIKVADANGCSFTGSSTVAVNGITPALNFLVSTSQNALDTLRVKEVCTPKPDSIQWTFDPQTVVIDNNMYTPLIRFNKEGNYMVAMRAWFGGCDFTDSKLITINPYDPNVVNNYNNLFGIDTVIVSPNPNNGNFNLRVKLYRNQRLLIKIYSVAGTVLWNKQWNYTSEVSEPVSLPANIGHGLVFIKVLTDDDVRDVEMLISK
jgi:hypothetical protein